MTVVRWRQWLNQARRALAGGRSRRRVPVVLRLEPLEGRITPQASLVFQFTPAAAIAGQPLSPAVQVFFGDTGEGMVFPVDGETVTMQVASGPGGFDASSTLTAVTGVNASGKAQPGVAYFPNLVFDTAGTYTLSATVTDTSDLGLGTVQSGPSDPILVNPAAASRFVVTPSATTVGQGEPLNVTVAAQDPFGNTATGYGGTVHFTASAAGASLPADYTFQTGDQGVHTFQGVTFAFAGAQTVAVADAANAQVGGRTGPIDVLQVPPHDILLSPSPQVIAVGQAAALGGTFSDTVPNGPIAVTVFWGDGAVDHLTLSAQARDFQASHVYTAEGAFFPLVEVANPDGAVGVGDADVEVVPGPVEIAADVQAGPGQTATGSASDATSSIGLTLTLPPADAHGAELLAAKLLSVPLPAGVDPADLLAFFDVRVVGAEAGDVAVWTFRIPSNLVPGAIPILAFQDPTTGVFRPFLPSPAPGSFLLFQDGGTIIGRVVFDALSTPSVLQLSRTVFTVSASVPGSVARAVVGAPVASAGPAAAVPARAATFQSTSQLTLALAASQAGQVSASLSSLSSAEGADGAGGVADRPPDDPWLVALYDAVGDDPMALWSYGGEGAIRLWARHMGATAPVAAPAPPKKLGPATSAPSEPPRPAATDGGAPAMPTGPAGPQRDAPHGTPGGAAKPGHPPARAERRTPLEALAAPAALLGLWPRGRRKRKTRRPPPPAAG